MSPLIAVVPLLLALAMACLAALSAQGEADASGLLALIASLGITVTLFLGA